MPGQLLFNYLGLNELDFAGQDIWLDHKVLGLWGDGNTGSLQPLKSRDCHIIGCYEDRLLSPNMGPLFL